jgi:hypothetical protein
MKIGYRFVPHNTICHDIVQLIAAGNTNQRRGWQFAGLAASMIRS